MTTDVSVQISVAILRSRKNDDAVLHGPIFEWELKGTVVLRRYFTFRSYD